MCRSGSGLASPFLVWLAAIWIYGVTKLSNRVIPVPDYYLILFGNQLKLYVKEWISKCDLYTADVNEYG